MITMRQDIEEVYCVLYKDAIRLATLLGTSISAPRTPRSSRQMQRTNAPTHPHGSTTYAIWQSRFLTTDFHNRFNPESRKCIEILALLCSQYHYRDGKCTTCYGRIDVLGVRHAKGLLLRAEVKQWQAERSFSGQNLPTQQDGGRSAF